MNSILERLRNEIARSTREATGEGLTRQPEGKWNTLQILEHLYLSYKGTARGLEKCIAEGKPLGGTPNLKQRAIIFVVTGLGYFPTGRKTPKQAAPRGTAPEEVLANIGPSITVMDELLAKCEASYGRTSYVLDHPILGPMTVGQWRKLHWLHGRHHIKQIRRLRGVKQMEKAPVADQNKNSEKQ